MLLLFRIGFLALTISACSTTVEPIHSVSIDHDPIEGFWRFSDRVTTVMIERCTSDPRKFCGLLVNFDGEANTRNFDTTDFNNWGERKCRSEILQVVLDPERPGFYIGRIQDPFEGQIYAIELNQPTKGILDAHTFLNVSVDESVDMLTEVAFGSPPSIFKASSYLVRALAGKELHSEVERWKRITRPLKRCDRPSIESEKGFQR